MELFDLRNRDVGVGEDPECEGIVRRELRIRAVAYREFCLRRRGEVLERWKKGEESEGGGLRSRIGMSMGVLGAVVE